MVTVADWQAARTFVRERHPHALLFNVPPDSVGSAWGAPPPIFGRRHTHNSVLTTGGIWLLEQEIFDDRLIKPIKTGHLLQLINHHCQQGTRLLLVDDDHSFAQLVRRIIQADGSHYSVHWASTGEDALSQLETQEFDLILLDIALPGIDGRTVAQTIRARENLACTPHRRH